MKTANEWYKDLPADIENLARKNSEGLSLQYDSLRGAMTYNFRWCNAPEGYKFWFGVCRVIDRKGELRRELDAVEYPEIPVTKEPTVTVNGKEYSEGTVALALKAYVG